MQSLSTRKSSQRDVSKGWFYGSQFHTNIQHCKGSRARVMPGDWLNLVIIASWPPLSSSQYSFVTKPKKHRDPDMATLSTCWSVAWGVDACLFFKLLGFFFSGLWATSGWSFMWLSLVKHLRSSSPHWPKAKHIYSKLKHSPSQTTNQWSLSD